MNPSRNQHHLEDEIDLGILLLKVTKSLSRYRYIILIFVILGAGGGISAYYSQTAKFGSDMIIESSILTEAYSNTMTETLERLIAEQNITLLSEKLNITTEQADHLIDISVKSISESKIDDETKNRIFKIHIETSNNEILADLQKGLISFLENNEYVKKRIDLKKGRLKKLISKVGKEIKEIDNLKAKINKNLISQQSGSNNLVIIDPTNVYENALDLYKEEIFYQESLELSSSIHLIEGFVAFKKPVSPKLLKSIVIGFALGLFLALGIVILLELRDYLKKLDEEMSANS